MRRGGLLPAVAIALATSASLAQTTPPAIPGQATATTTLPAPAPAPRLICAYVLAPGSPDLVPRSASAPASASAPTTSAACQKPTATLEGSGDVFVVAGKTDWDKATSVAQDASSRLQLYINGVSAGDGSSLVGVEALGDGTVKVRFHVAADKTTRGLWTALYRERAMDQPGPLRPSVGWSTHTDALLAPAGPLPQVQVTTQGRFVQAATALVLLGLFLLWCMGFTPIFRDGPTIADRRATFSLARVQVGLWLFFVVGAAAYLRLVLGALPTLEPSVAGLLVLSAATTVASAAVSSSTNPTPDRSRNFLSDILTSPDGAQQLHRLQAMLVNGLLLLVGIDSVVENLAYPIFDSSWLALLGISGATQAAMKQVTESQAPPPGPAAPRPAPPVPTGTAPAPAPAPLPAPAPPAIPPGRPS